MAAVACLDATMEDDNAPPFPLECLLCSKKPTFSDSSHLLTHVSSKAHLHQKFSLEFRAKSDPSAKETLEQFESWYVEHGIERLLSERLATKGIRKPARRSRTTSKNTKIRKSTSAVDDVKAEERVASRAAFEAQTPENLPRLSHWSTAPAGTGMDYANVPYSHSPLSLRQRYAYPLPDEVGGNGCGMKHSQFEAVFDTSHSTGPPSEVDSSFGVGFTDDEAQASRLKGVVWPGMNLFDSATPGQKKMRNQRKGAAAVNHLKLTSQTINAIETVWGPEGDVRKERDIYASPSIEGTPPNTPPRKRKQRSRNAASSASTPLSIMRGEDGQDNQPTTKRIGRLTGAALLNGRESIASARAGKGNKKHKSGVLDDSTDVEEAVLALSSPKPNEGNSFSVYYEDDNNGTAIDPQLSLTENSRENGFDHAALHNRPALQQLDPNLSISEVSPYFKHSTSTRFFDNGTDPSSMSFRGQASPYGHGYQGISGTSLGNLSSQPRSSGMYPPFDNQMFHGLPGGDGSAGYTASGNRRMGFGNFSLDPSSSPFGYNDQRDASIRDPNFQDSSYQGASRLFDL